MVNHFIISYDLIDSKKFNGSYRDQMIEFLLDNGGKDIKSYVATVIYFSSSLLKDIEHWMEELEFLQSDITYHISSLESNEADKPIMYMYFDTEYADNFDADVERIKKSKGY